jgi:PAS domain S-box-containing protein
MESPGYDRWNDHHHGDDTDHTPPDTPRDPSSDRFVRRREMELANREWLIVSRAEQLRQREEALQSRERHLEQTLEAVGDTLWEWSTATGQLRIGRRYFTMLGYGPDELPVTFATWRSLVHPDDLERALEAMNGNLEACARFSVTFRMRAKDGMWRRILGQGKVLNRDARGCATRALGIHMDVTALVAARR